MAEYVCHAFDADMCHAGYYYGITLSSWRSQGDPKF